MECLALIRRRTLPGSEVAAPCAGDGGSIRPGARAESLLVPLFNCHALAANQLHGHLGERVCLAKHGHGRLGEDLVADELRHFRRHIDIRNS